MYCFTHFWCTCTCHWLQLLISKMVTRTFLHPYNIIKFKLKEKCLHLFNTSIQQSHLTMHKLITILYRHGHAIKNKRQKSWNFYKNIDFGSQMFGIILLTSVSWLNSVLPLLLICLSLVYHWLLKPCHLLVHCNFLVILPS